MGWVGVDVVVMLCMRLWAIAELWGMMLLIMRNLRNDG